MYNKEDILKDLSALGINKGDVVLMHSSYKSLGEIKGGAKTFFEALLEQIDEEGTLIVPSLSYEYVTAENPLFDIENTPSCVGYLSEYFRTSVEGVVRSMHPTHSCCAKGRLALDIVKDHQMDKTPVGENSPFYKVAQLGGKILMLGCGTRCNTLMHGVEETAEPPYCIDRKNPVKYLLKNGESVKEHIAFKHYFITHDGRHYIQRYDRIVDLLDKTEYCKGKVLEADSFLLNAQAVWEKGHTKLKQEPMYFVDEPK